MKYRQPAQKRIYPITTTKVKDYVNRMNPLRNKFGYLSCDCSITLQLKGRFVQTGMNKVKYLAYLKNRDTNVALGNFTFIYNEHSAQIEQYQM